METAADRLESLAQSLPRRRPRGDLGPVEALAARAGIVAPARAAVVVGTNGKTSTATFLARLLQAGGLRVGLTVSPHLRRWSERVLVDAVEVDEDELAGRVAALAGTGAGLDLRFFDLMTFAAAQIFADRGVDVAVFEAGIGGRLDATSVLRPQLVVLTGVGLDHTELLGSDEVSIMREKLGVAPAGAVVVSAPLGPELEAEAARLAARAGFRLVPAPDAGSTFLERNWSLAQAAAAQVATPALTGSPEPVVGRMQRAVVDGTPVVLDAAHNVQAWRTLAAELPPRYVAVVSVSTDKPAAGLRDALGGATAVIATTAWPGRSLDATELAVAVGGEAIDEPRVATRAGLDRARDLGVPLVVFGSAYLLRHALEELGL
jgi:dihydrofolate synthase / folylpolyglutamate synthase